MSFNDESGAGGDSSAIPSLTILTGRGKNSPGGKSAVKENVASILSDYSDAFNGYINGSAVSEPFSAAAPASPSSSSSSLPPSQPPQSPPLPPPPPFGSEYGRLVDIEETNPGAFRLVVKGGLQRFFAALEGSGALEQRPRYDSNGDD